MNKSRRSFIKKSVQVAASIPLLSAGMPFYSFDKAPSKLKILILGGTSFLGPHQIAYAMQRGHEVTIFTRGRTTPTLYPLMFNNIEQLIGDRENDLKALKKGKWDVVIDNSGHKADWTLKSSDLLKKRAKLYIYTSSTGVYYPYLTGDIKEDKELVTKMPSDIEDESVKAEYEYGVMKTKSEMIAKSVFGEDRTLVVRPTYMVGPGDKTNRFIHWPLRVEKGGQMLVPGNPNDLLQYIDVRDVAEWMIRLAEEEMIGTYNAVGPVVAQPMEEFIGRCIEIINGNCRPVVVDDYNFLTSEGVLDMVPWIMPTGNNYGSARINNDLAIQNGLKFRMLEFTLRDTLSWWNSPLVSLEQKNKFYDNLDNIWNREEKILKDWDIFHSKFQNEK